MGPARARAASAVSASDRRFIFVTTMGGWDATRVFADLLASKAVDTEPEASATTAHGLTYVDHPDRPSVRAFYESYGDKLCIFNGVYVSSISHGSAIRLMLTGTVTAKESDWATRIAADRGDDFVIPLLVIGGPNFSGANGVHVGRTGLVNQLEGLLNGEIVAEADVPVVLPSVDGQNRVDEYLAWVAGERQLSPKSDVEAARLNSYSIALERARSLKQLGTDIDLSSDTPFENQCELAARVLNAGLSRCVAITHPDMRKQIEWDSHNVNDESQNGLFESLFSDLIDLQTLLEATPGNVAATLAEETVVVILSEMGRTPYLNGSAGKDHWPYSTLVMYGAGVVGGQAIGEYDDNQIGQTVDLDSGGLSDKGEQIDLTHIGATLLTLAGMDSAAEGLNRDPIMAAVQ
jgi:uncharacterized protein (DUF1501 family)